MNLTKYINDTFTKKSSENKKFIDLFEEYIVNKNENNEEVKYLESFYNYCNYNYKTIRLTQMNKEMFLEYLLYYLPKTIKILTYESAQILMEQLYDFSESLKNNNTLYNGKIFDEVYYEMMDDFPRIMELKKEFKNFLGYPVLSFNPLVIDINNYKRSKDNKKPVKYDSIGSIMEQGNFEVMEIFGDSIIILRKITGNELYVKIVLDEQVSNCLREHDIINMRISRRLFFTTWNIEDVKACYSYRAKDYLK